MAFVPATVEVTAGDSVVWRFGGRHDARFDTLPGSPPDIPDSPEGRYGRLFETPGTFRYRCTLHSGMNGEVVVRPKAG